MRASVSSLRTGHRFCVKRFTQRPNCNRGDFIEGVVCAPFSEDYRFCGIVARPRADMTEWQLSARRSILFSGRCRSAHTQFYVTDSGRECLSPYTDPDNVSARCLRKPILTNACCGNRKPKNDCRASAGTQSPPDRPLPYPPEEEEGEG